MKDATEPAAVTDCGKRFQSTIVLVVNDILRSVPLHLGTKSFCWVVKPWEGLGFVMRFRAVGGTAT